MKITLRLSLTAFFLIVLVLPPLARTYQSPGNVPQSTDRSQLPSGLSVQTYRTNVDLVNVFVSVWNKDTKSFNTNLSREDFAVYEDGKKQEITNFAREANMPLTIALLVDTSQSVAPKLKFEQDAATNFFYTVLKQSDRAMIVEFDSAVSLVQDLTNEPNKLAKKIREMQAAGNTALYDAIYRVCDEKLIREAGRKTIVILSDGDDSASTETLERAREMAINAEATIFSISINRGGFFGVGGDTRAGDKVLTQLADITGGKPLFPFQVEELDAAFREISQELRSQYNIGYFSSNPLRDGAYRKIEVRVGERNLRLNYRKGYYAPVGR
jgi:Ca-activated chloride channel family protein